MSITRIRALKNPAVQGMTRLCFPPGRDFKIAGSGLPGPRSAFNYQLSTSREYEPQNKEPQNIEVKNIVSLLSKTSAVRNSLFDIVLRTPHPAGGSPVSIFKIQKKLNPALSCSESSVQFSPRQNH